jgi:hypothetical protein
MVENRQQRSLQDLNHENTAPRFISTVGDKHLLNESLESILGRVNWKVTECKKKTMEGNYCELTVIGPYGEKILYPKVDLSQHQLLQKYCSE